MEKKWRKDKEEFMLVAVDTNLSRTRIELKKDGWTYYGITDIYVVEYAIFGRKIK